MGCLKHMGCWDFPSHLRRECLRKHLCTAKPDHYGSHESKMTPRSVSFLVTSLISWGQLKSSCLGMRGHLQPDFWGTECFMTVVTNRKECLPAPSLWRLSVLSEGPCVDVSFCLPFDELGLSVSRSCLSSSDALEDSPDWKPSEFRITILLMDGESLEGSLWNCGHLYSNEVADTSVNGGCWSWTWWKEDLFLQKSLKSWGFSGNREEASTKLRVAFRPAWHYRWDMKGWEEFGQMGYCSWNNWR